MAAGRRGARAHGPAEPERAETPAPQRRVAHRLRGGLVDLRPVVAGGWLRDLAVLVGYEEGTAPDVLVESLQRHGAFRHAALRYNQVRDPRSLLALFANGEDLTPDHGYPARIIVPAAPWRAQHQVGGPG